MDISLYNDLIKNAIKSTSKTKFKKLKNDIWHNKILNANKRQLPSRLKKNIIKEYKLLNEITNNTNVIVI